MGGGPCLVKGHCIRKLASSPGVSTKQAHTILPIWGLFLAEPSPLGACSIEREPAPACFSTSPSVRQGATRFNLLNVALQIGMPRISQSSDNDTSESRTAAVGLKGQARRTGQVHSAPSLSSESSRSSQSSTMGNAASQPAEHSSTVKLEQAENMAESATMDTTSPGFGQNRLATGFRKLPSREGPPSASSGPLPNKNNPAPTPALSPGASMHDAIEISDDDQDDDGSDDGGMVINIDGPQNHGLSQDMDVDNDEDGSTWSREDGEIESHPSTRETTQPLSAGEEEAHDQLQGDLEDFLGSISGKPTNQSSTTTVPVSSVPRLADLNKHELELQLKYAFFGLDQNKIDLNRPAVCLTCLQGGHAERNCPEIKCEFCSAEHSSRLCPLLQRCSTCRDRGHMAESCPTGMRVTTVPCDICGGLSHVEQTCPQRFFPCDRKPGTQPLELWVSCCRCASTQHLVGDCPHVHQAAAARWSLKSFDPGQIINLTLEPATRRREQEAANRGLRPEGLKIRGRASLHSAGAPQFAQQDDADDEQFLRARVDVPGNASRGSITVAAKKANGMPSTLPSSLPKSDPAMPSKKQKTSHAPKSNITVAINKPKSKASDVPLHLPKKEIMNQFIDVLNNGRRSANKSQLQLHYHK